jgi:hypothetical protein
MNVDRYFIRLSVVVVRIVCVTAVLCSAGASAAEIRLQEPDHHGHLAVQPC